MARARQASHNAPTLTKPQGRLTLTTATPVMTAEAAAQTTIYYTPYVGDVIPLYNGTEWQNFVFTELSIAMAASANWAADSNFDLFVYNDAGTLRLVTGAAWTNGTTRAEALVRTNGIWLNNVSFTGRYGAASTVSIAASRATYVGTMRTTGTAGTTTWELGGAAAGGDPGALHLWNCYNRVEVAVLVQTTNASWTYATAAWRPYDGAASNVNVRVALTRGLNENAVTGMLNVTHYGGGSIDGAAGISLDSTTTIPTQSSYLPNAASALSNSAQFSAHVGIGYHYVQAMEYTGGATSTFYGISNPIQNGLYVRGMF
jgi:hypothetical protein